MPWACVHAAPMVLAVAGGTGPRAGRGWAAAAPGGGGAESHSQSPCHSVWFQSRVTVVTVVTVIKLSDLRGRGRSRVDLGTACLRPQVSTEGLGPCPPGKGAEHNTHHWAQPGRPSGGWGKYELPSGLQQAGDATCHVTWCRRLWKTRDVGTQGCGRPHGMAPAWDSGTRMHTGERARLPAASCARAGARGPGLAGSAIHSVWLPRPCHCSQGDVTLVTPARAPPWSCSGPSPAVLETGVRSVWEAKRHQLPLEGGDTAFGDSCKCPGGRLVGAAGWGWARTAFCGSGL